MPESVLIVGCGVLGLSTALELSKRGYSVTAIDAHQVPSPWSAACDYNKIIRTEYEDIIYTKLAVEAWKIWRSDELYMPAYRECGRILITPELHIGRKEFEKIGIANLKSLGYGNGITYAKGSKQMAKDFELLKFNSIKDLTEYKFNPEAGLGVAAKSLERVYLAAKNNGVKFIFGPAGNVSKIESIDGKDYVIASDGSSYTADKIVIATGAACGRLLDLKQQQSASGLFVTHIKLTEQEFEKFKSIPIVFDSDLGYFFPPDEETRVLKIALPGSGTQNFVTSSFREETRSLPSYRTEQPNITIPVECIKQAKKLLETFVPELAYHNLFDHKTCWIADTSDSHYIIDKVPYLSQVYAATGDSGHAYKLLPTIGRYISDKLENKLDKELEKLWRWREHLEGFDATKLSWRISSDNTEFSSIKWAEQVYSDNTSRL